MHCGGDKMTNLFSTRSQLSDLRGRYVECSQIHDENAALAGYFLGLNPAPNLARPKFDEAPNSGYRFCRQYSCRLDRTYAWAGHENKIVRGKESLTFPPREYVHERITTGNEVNPRISAEVAACEFSHGMDRERARRRFQLDE